jgi:hypothetical protein
VQENQAFSAGQVSLQEKRLDSVVFLVEVQKDSPVEGAKVSQNEHFDKILNYGKNDFGALGKLFCLLFDLPQIICYFVFLVVMKVCPQITKLRIYSA